MTEPDFSNFTPCPKAEPKPKKVYAGLKRTALNKKPKGNTDQLDTMIEVFNERGATCEITGEYLGEFDPFCVHHLLNKNNYKRFRCYKPNMIVIHPDIHYAYHSNDREYVLSMWPKAIVLYDRAEELRIEYNMPKPII
jgi:hypothetical protein